MKKLLALILIGISTTALAQFSPTQDRKGFIGGYFRGANLDVTNITFYTASGVAFAAIDQYAGVTLSDTNGVTKFLFDGFDSTLSLMDKLGTVRLDVDAANKLHINNPIITGTLTGNISGATNLPVSGLNTNGGTPGQVATAQANGTVTWSNAPAGGGSSVTFNPNQFGSSSIGTNLLSGVLLTNAVNRISDETIFVTDSSGAGNPLLSWDSDNGDIRVHANLVVRDGFYGHGGNLTNLNASELSSGTVPLARLAGVMTNNNVNRFVIFTNNLYALYVETNGTVFYTNYSASSQGVSITSNGTVYVGGNLHLAGGTVSAPTVIRFDIAGANGITRFSGTGLGVGGANQANSSGTAFTAYGIGTFSSYAMATNGYAFIDASTFPTSSIPAGSATRTNFSMIAYKGFPRTVATNIATGGWMEFTNGNWFPFTP